MITIPNPFDRASETSTLWELMKDGDWHSREELQSKINRKLDGALNYLNQKGREHAGKFWVTRTRLNARLEFRATEVETIIDPVTTKKGTTTPAAPVFTGEYDEIDPNNYSTVTVDLMDRFLRSKLVAQDEAIDSMVDVYQRLVAEMHDPEKPLGNLLFLGPTGTGKTYAVECLAEFLYPPSNDYPTISIVGTDRFGNKVVTGTRQSEIGKGAIIKIDCGEYQEDHQIARLIGAPPGYIGFDVQEKSMLHPSYLDSKWSPVLKRKVAILLFDEIEKASSKLFRLLLGILDKGKLRMGDNTEVDLRHCIVVMTSNLGAEEISKLLRDKKGGELDEDSALQRQLKMIAVESARSKFPPEFFNRLDEITAFKPLPEEAIQRIVVLELQHVDKRISRSRGAQVFIKYEQSTIEHLMKIGFDAQFGARALKRAIDQVVVKPISKLLSGGAVKAGDSIRVKADENGTRFYKGQVRTA